MAKATVGDWIVASVVLAIALCLTLGRIGIPFLDWIAFVALVIAGIMMVRGSLGTNATIGWSFIILGPALFALPAFLPTVGAILWIVAILATWALGLTKLFALW